MSRKFLFQRITLVGYNELLARRGKLCYWHLDKITPCLAYIEFGYSEQFILDRKLLQLRSSAKMSTAYNERVSFIDRSQWRIYIVKFWTRAPPWGSKFFQFHAVFGKIWQNRMLAPPLGSWRPLLGEILDPPLVLSRTL